MMKTECNTCGKEFEADSVTWARHKETGEEAVGYNGSCWYGSDRNWTEDEIEKFEMQVGGVGTFGKCESCQERYHRARERAQEYSTPLPPDWFDPDFAGERWDEDY